MKFPLFIILIATSALSLTAQQGPPIDGLFAKSGLESRRLLPYPPLRQADLVYEKRQTRSLDSRELLNLPFRHPDFGFFQALVAGVEAGDLKIYDPAFPDFSQELNGQDWLDNLNSRDTIPVTDPVTGVVSWQEIFNVFDPDDVVRYRIREVVYFDRQTSTQRVRIIGIAPLIQATDELGASTYEYALGWIYWPHARQWFDQQQYFTDASDTAVLSWSDAMEMRRFSSHIIEQSNVRGDRLSAHYSGRQLLLQSEKLATEQANREHDMWSN